MELSSAEQFLLTCIRDHHRVNTDTRQTRPGDLFFALRGARFDGNLYATEALARGASFAVIDRPDQAFAGDDRYIVVPDSLACLQRVATAWRLTFSIPVIGLTGSNGKTTTKELVASVLSTEKKIHATAGNFNNHIGVPLTLLAMPRYTEIAVVEMGTNMPGDIPQLVEFAQPTHTLITNVGEAHLENLGSLDGVMVEKGAVYRWVRDHGGFAFVNESDERVLKASEGVQERCTYGGPDSDVTFHILEEKLDGMRIEIRMKHWDAPMTVETQLAGFYNALNVAVAAAIGDHFGISKEGIQKGLYQYVPANQRSQLIRSGNRNIWLDAYNANPSSMKASVSHAFRTGAHKVALILGDMLELGPDEYRMHAELGEWLDGFNPFMVIGIGPRMQSLIEAVRTDGHWFATAAEALPRVPALIQDADFVLLKGSRGMRLEMLLEAVRR